MPKRFRGKITETERTIITWILRYLKSVENESSTGMFGQNWEQMLIPWLPREIFGINEKKELQKFSRTLKSLEDKGYIVRKRERKRSPTSYITVTNDGLLIAKTWARISDTGEDSEFRFYEDLEYSVERQDTDMNDLWEREEDTN